VFCMSIDDLLADSGVGCFVGFTFVGTLAYADDYVLIAPTPSAMCQLLMICDIYVRLNMDKTELIWTGTKHNLSKILGSGRALTLGGAQIAQSDDVHVLRVQLSSDLSLDKHFNVVSAKCFFQLR